MANSATVYARIDPTLKNEVENILRELGVTPSHLIQMLYSQIKLTSKIPFEIGLPSRKPIYVEDLTEEELSKEIEKGIQSAKEGRFCTLEEVEEMIKKKYNL